MTRVMKANDETGQSTVRLFQNIPGTALNSECDPPSGYGRPDILPPSIPKQEEKNDLLRKQIARLEVEVGQFRAKLEGASTLAEAREEKSFKQGHEAGVRKEREQDEKRIELLAASLSDAQEVFGKRQAGVEVLALSIANTAVCKVLGNKDKYANLIADAIDLQLRRLQGELILEALVSPIDFPSDVELDGLRKRFPKLDIVAGMGLHSGECRMAMKLGKLDLGIPSQWSLIQEMFAKLADEAVAVL